MTDYVTKRAEAQAMKYFTTDNAVHFIFEHIITRFGFPKIVMSDRGENFVNETIQSLTEEFRIHHAKSTPYHPQENGAVEAFNKIFKQALTKVFNFDRSDWDVHIPSVLVIFQNLHAANWNINFC